MIRALKICAVLILTSVLIVEWQSNSAATSISRQKPSQRNDQKKGQAEAPDRAEPKNNDQRAVVLNLGSLPTPPAPDLPDAAKTAKQERATTKIDGSKNIDPQNKD